ncbi:MAG: hypothetical protein AAGB31_08430, partial [Bdellovibrio sp.]
MKTSRWFLPSALPFLGVGVAFLLSWVGVSNLDAFFLDLKGALVNPKMSEDAPLVGVSISSLKK